jgi:hypothetical protein
MKTFRLVLTPDQVNTALRALEGLPYREAFDPINAIHSQCTAQVERDSNRAAAKSEPAATVPTAKKIAKR